MQPKRAAFIGFILLAFMTGCDGSAGSDGNANTSPDVRITRPAEGSVFSAADVVPFEGRGSDPEDGSLGGASLGWRSDVDGPIGAGETVLSGTLTAGDHQITLSGTDADGAVGMDTVAITIGSGLPDTGQTASYTDTFGEDADYTRNPPTYTRLDASGNALSVGVEAWAMVRDDVTGLIWEVKTDDGSIHDREDTYTWSDARDVFIARLNRENFGGHADWRLPDVRELAALVHADAVEPAIDTACFPNTAAYDFPEIVSAEYWSETGYAGNPAYAWYVDFNGGDVGNTGTSATYFVRAVRGGR